MAKILFLDIDSVLNVAEYGNDLYWNGDGTSNQLVELNVPLFKANVDNLKHILEEVPDLKIVWSTDWRLYDKAVYDGWKNPLQWLESQPWIEGRVIGKTPKKMSSTHYEEIRMWFTTNKDIKVEKFAILDDYVSEGMVNYFKDNFFQCMYETGLTMEIADKVIRHLKEQNA